MIDYGTVSILMGTYNGEKYLEKQLESIRNQTYENWMLYISDDGSTDNTLQIIQDFSVNFPAGKVTVLKGPGIGFAENFLYLMKNKQIHSHYYAFSDQDDIWLENKLEVSVKCVSTLEESGNRVVLYGGRTSLINNDLKILGLSPLFNRHLSFNNALIQSFSGGNTMLFNHALKALVERLPPKVNIVSHDWFLYILCSGVGGKVHYDPEPLVLYRQHDENLVGSNNGVLSKFKRLNSLLRGEFKKWSIINDRMLKFYKKELTPENLLTFEAFSKCNDKSGLVRIKGFIRASLYRQNKIETAVFMMMSILNKLK